MNPSPRRNVLLSSGICLLSALSISVEAAETETEIEEVVVTATKRAESISDIPFEIDAMSEDDLNSANIEDVRYLIGGNPKLAAMTNFGQFASVISSRGVVGSTNLDPTVGFYVDDLPFALAGYGWSPAGGMFDLQRVEVLGGPQGTLYGQGSLTGTVRMITNDPDTENFSAAVELGYADITDGENDESVSAMVNIPVIENKLGARLAYSDRKEGGFIDSTLGLGDDINEADYEDIRLKVLATPTDALTIKATYWESTVDAPYPDAQISIFGLVYPEDREDIVYLSGDQSSETEATTLRVDYDFGPVTVTNSYSDMDYDQVQDNVTLVNIGVALSQGDTKTNEFRITSNFEGPFQFVAGHYYLDGQTDVDLEITLDPTGGLLGGALGGPSPLGLNRTTVESEVSALFGEVTYELLDGRVILLAGVRDFEDDRKFSQLVSPIIGLPDPVFGPPELNEETFTKTTTRFNIAWTPSEDVDLMLFLNVAEGFRSGMFNVQIAQDGAAEAGYPFDTSFVEPDVNESFDLGLKYNSQNGLFSADVTAYWSTVEGIQQSVDFTRGARLFAASFVNAGDLDVTGVDYNLTLRPTDSLAFNLQGSYIDAEYDTLGPLIADFSSLREGGPAAGVPENQLRFSAVYTRSLGLIGGTELTVYGEYRFRSKSTDTTGSGLNTIAPDTKKVNARITLAKPDDWSVSLYVDNLTDEKDIISASFGTFNAIPRPRQVGISLRKDFGQ